MVKNLELSEQARTALVETARTTDDARLRQRCQAVLLSTRGLPQMAIARDLGAGVRTVRGWLQLYRRGGLEGLRIRWAPGRERRIPDSYAPQVLEWIKAGPLSCGVDRANWTHEELASHLKKKTGIRASETTMRDFCHRHHVRPYRPTYRFLRGNPEKQASAKEHVATQKTR
jgi:transposase